jgi:hypothetical protein
MLNVFLQAHVELVHVVEPETGRSCPRGSACVSRRCRILPPGCNRTGDSPRVRRSLPRD